MSYDQVSIHTEVGHCPSYVFTPPRPGRYPAVIFYTDGLGIRPTNVEMGQGQPRGPRPPTCVRFEIDCGTPHARLTFPRDVCPPARLVCGCGDAHPGHR
jgi:hypothetical protein